MAAGPTGGVRKRSITIDGHATSYSLEDAFQQQLEAIARTRGIPLARLIGDIDREPRMAGGLSSALRLFVLNHLLAQLDQSAVNANA